MPSKSIEQKHFMQMVYAYKKGVLPLSKIPKKIRKKVIKAASEMTFKQLRDFFVLKRSKKNKNKNEKKGRKNKKAISRKSSKRNIRIIK